MVKTKTKISKQEKRKTNPSLVETIRLAKKNEKWLDVAGLLSGPRRRKVNLNLSEIDKEVKEGDSVLIPGKVLSQGNVSKKIKVVGLGFSKNAKEKLLNSKCEVVYIKDEIKKNPSAKGLKILNHLKVTR